MLPLEGIDLFENEDQLVLRRTNGNLEVRDPVRKKFYKINPEEWVRQLWLLHLYKNQIPYTRMAVERAFEVASKRRRFDLLVYDQFGKPLLLAEFKEPDVAITQDVFDQVSVYNEYFQIPFALISNGISHYCFRYEMVERKFEFQNHLPF